MLIIYDGSIDKSFKMAFDFVRKYKINNKNYGNGEVIKECMLHSYGNLLLMLDIDGPTKITNLEKA
ncbi:dolichyl-phosphate beta-glucosyltransferase [Dendrobium catenatum]|uniref:Dolichyl-phosphate beta-glucosyltransferase n=1 Tax=Dendrobium catenatum TaxID=906689 RepID=A0A2I0W8E9_9ASPA|nr:dolichyl-phosphate beta-glucosyltransferase [Dendrobium catenatum]